MQEEAYEALAELQESHWWYVGARYVYRELIRTGLRQQQRYDQHRSPACQLDIGCGAGGNLELLKEFSPTVGMDISSKALQAVRIRPTLGLVQASTQALPFANGSFDAAHLFGVIEHLDDDLTALQEARRVCRPAGFITLLTSAMPILWSHHDEANLHRRRYLRRDLAERLEQAGLKPLILSYQNFFVFLPTLLLRLLQRLFPSPPRYDMGSPPRLLNAMLILLLRLEAWLISRVSLPIGVDLVAVCHKAER